MSLRKETPCYTGHYPFKWLKLSQPSRASKWVLDEKACQLFILSTLGGDPMETSTVNKEVLRKILEFANEVLNKCPRGDTVIHRFKGADS